MAKYEYTYVILKDYEEVYKSTSEVSLTKKDFREIEEFMKEHSYSCNFIDIPSRIYDKCLDYAYEKAYKEYPDISIPEDDYLVDLEEFIPECFIRQLSEETKRKVLPDHPYYAMDYVEGLEDVSEELKVDACSEKSQEEPMEQEGYIVPTKENTLYLPIKQVYFDAIIEGSKKEEYREIKPTTYKKYLECDGYDNPYFDNSLMSDNNPLCGDIYVWNNGVYPYIPKRNYEFLNLAVGYNKERDTAIVEIEGVSFEPLSNEKGLPMRFTVKGEDVVPSDKGELCVWLIVYHLGKIIEVHRHK